MFLGGFSLYILYVRKVKTKNHTKAETKACVENHKNLYCRNTKIPTQAGFPSNSDLEHKKNKSEGLPNFHKVFPRFLRNFPKYSSSFSKIFPQISQNFS
jgi:hypothetical protein